MPIWSSEFAAQGYLFHAGPGTPNLELRTPNLLLLILLLDSSFLLHHGQIAVELGRLIVLAEYSNSTLVGLNHLTGNRESKTNSLSILTRSPVEFIEHPSLLLLAQSGAGINNTESDKVGCVWSSFQNDLRVSISILDRVRDEVRKHD